jgi:hypothetical protein
MSFGKHWKSLLIFFLGMLLVFIPSCVASGYLRDTKTELIQKCITISGDVMPNQGIPPKADVPVSPNPDPVLPKIIAVEDVTSSATDPIERERQIRVRFERRTSWDGLDDVQTIEPFFENGHLSCIRIHRNGQHSKLQYMIVLPSDETDNGRKIIRKVIESSSTCIAHKAPFYDHGKISTIFYLIYICESTKKT